MLPTMALLPNAASRPEIAATLEPESRSKEKPMSSQSSEASVFQSEVRSLTSYLLDSNLLFGAAPNLLLPLI